MRRSTIRTCTSMVMAHGDTGEHWYGVFVGKMRGPGCFDLHSAEQVATYKLGRGDKADYAAMTAKHATTAAPPVYWQVPGFDPARPR